MKALRDIGLSDRDRHAVEAAAEALRGHFPVERVILFGSKARRQDDAESDIDLLVLTSRPLTRREKHQVVEVLYPLQLDLEVVFSTLEVPRDDWEHGLYQVLPLRVEIERDGVLV